MRMIGVLFTILGSAMAIRAQVEQPALQGLPAYGVALSGSPENPVIENHSGRVVIGYHVKLTDANGRVAGLPAQVMADSMLPEGIPDGSSVYAKGALPINPTVPMPGPPQVRFTGQGPIVTAALRSVIFADGQFVGADEQRTTCSVEPGQWWVRAQGAQPLPFRDCLFEEFGKKLKVIIEVGILAKTRAWDQIEALAQALHQRPWVPPPNGEDINLTIFRQLVAQRLVVCWACSAAWR
jgi:hypothetical protein